MISFAGGRGLCAAAAAPGSDVTTCSYTAALSPL